MCVSTVYVCLCVRRKVHTLKHLHTLWFNGISAYLRGRKSLSLSFGLAS